MADVQIWRYVVPSEKHEGWGIFLLDSTGYFSVVSDFGNYAHLWTHHGCDDFREFLCKIDKSYLCSKLCTQKVVDEERTLKLIRETLDHAEKDDSISKDELEVERGLLKNLELTGVLLGFEIWAEDTRLSPTWEYRSYGYPSDLKGFADKVYPRFVQLLRKDLE